MNQKINPPSNTRWIIGNQDLPQNYGAARFLITKETGKAFTLVLSKRKRQVLEALMNSPLYFASPIRLSDNVGILRHEHDVSIDTEFYEDESGPILTRYGIYSLADKAEYLGEVSSDKEAA
jgi:hypothetical protein